MKIAKSSSSVTRRPARRRGSRSPDTQQAILLAAEEVLISEGYAKFTTRRVAQAAGLGSGNITYHYPTKLKLTAALIEFVLARYVSRIRAPLKLLNSRRDAERQMSELVDWLLADSFNPRTSRLFRELWAMAAHSPTVATAMQSFYERTNEAAKDLICTANPEISAEDSHTLAALISVISEGVTVLFGLETPSSRYLASVRRLAGSVVAAIVANPGAYLTPARRRPTPPT